MWPKSSWITLKHTHTVQVCSGEFRWVQERLGKFRRALPGKTPHQGQVVFPSRHKMAAVICELETGDILVVPTEDRQQSTCGHLNQSETSIKCGKPQGDDFN